MMPTCLITGATGFIGRALCQHLLNHNYSVHGTARTPSCIFSREKEKFHWHITGDIDGHTKWHNALHQVDVIVHLAGTVHRPDIKDMRVYQRSIVEATHGLIEQAISAGVKRLVYVSSSHVYGVSASVAPISEAHLCHPKTPYAQAKWQAEQLLQEQMEKTALEIVIVRPPLVYGPGVRGNFAQLLKLIQRLPCLPFGCATQLRSWVGLNNLVAFLQRCMEHPQAANAVFNITDDHDISTRMLCEKLTELMHKKRVFLPVPRPLMQIGLKWCGQTAMYDKLFAAMQLDMGLAKNKLGWRSPFSVDKELENIF